MKYVKFTSRSRVNIFTHLQTKPFYFLEIVRLFKRSHGVNKEMTSTVKWLSTALSYQERYFKYRFLCELISELALFCLFNICKLRTIKKTEVKISTNRSLYSKPERLIMFSYIHVHCKMCMNTIWLIFGFFFFTFII